MRYLAHHLLRESARSYPDKEFLVQEERRHSFREVEGATDRIARALAGAGVARGDRVGVFLDHSLDQIFGFFGISKAGGVYVPMNSLLKGHQVNHIARDCQTIGLLVDEKRLELLREHLGAWPFLRFLVVVGDPPGWLAGLDLQILRYQEILEQPEADPLRDLAIGGDLAALLYTSGSTGRPKGVMISHDNLTVGARIVTSYVENQHDDRLLGVLPLSFDYGLNQVTSSALLGMTYVMKSFRFPGELVDVLLKERISGFAGIPTIWLLLLQTGSPVYKRTFEDLRYITNSGGVFPPHAIEKVRRCFPGTRVILMYGLTEAFRSTYLPPDQIERRPTSMGRAIPGCEMLVVNKEGRLCQPGEEGQLVHRGPTVALGYWGNPEKTAEVYRPNPFLPEHLQHTERLVYSGDLVKADEEGYLYFVSREDHMIKCYGHRISPAEIEEALYSSGKVKLCAAIGRPHPVKGQSIKVFVVPNPGVDLDDEAVLGLCAEKLPQFMMPEEVELLEELPRTGTGKVDLALLKQRSTSTTEQP